MATILFVMRYPLRKGDNLKGKFDGQIAAARALGHQAYYIGWDDDAFWLMGGERPERLVGAGCTRLPAYEHTLLYVRLMRAARKAVMTKPIDAIYLRYMPTFRSALRAVREAKKRGVKLIVEHPTYPFEQGKVTSALRRPFFWYVDRVFAKIEPMIDLYAIMGEDAHGAVHGVPAVNVLNGVDASRLPPHKPRPEAQDISLLALASMSYWQGYDRMIRALAAYKGPRKVALHLVGNEGDGSLAKWKALANDLGVRDRAFFHPAMHGEELDRFIEGCDVGVGGLGWYRKKQYVSNTLKLREYMARGLPFVYAPVAVGIPDEPRYCISVPNDDTPVDLERIVDFALRVKRDADAPAEMRRYAEERLSWKGVMQTVLERAGIPCD